MPPFPSRFHVLKPYLETTVREPVTRDDQRLDVMSFNIRYQNAGDTGERSWDARKDAVVKVIETADPDVVGIQEALHAQVEHVALGLDHRRYAWVGAGREDGKLAGEFSPVFFKTGRFVLVDSGTFWLSGTPDVPGSNTWHNACTRICTWCILDDRESPGAATLFMNVHADHRNARARVKGSALVIERMLALAPGSRVVITGDFNTIGKERSIRVIEGNHGRVHLRNARDAWIRGGGKGTRVPAVTWHAFNGPSGGGLVARVTRGLLDHVFISSTFDIDAYRVIEDKIDDIYPSDHFPVVATLRAVR